MTYLSLHHQQDLGQLVQDSVWTKTLPRNDRRSLSKAARNEEREFNLMPAKIPSFD